MAESRGKKARSGNNRTAYAIIAGIALVLIITSIIIYAVSAGEAKSPDEAELVEAVFADGITVAGVNVSGMTLLKAEPLVRAEADKLLDGFSMKYDVNGTQYPVTAYELGAKVDHVGVLTEAMLYDKEGTIAERAEKRAEAAEKGVDFSLSITTDRAAAAEALSKHGVLYNTEPVNATIKVNKTQNSNTLVCDGEITYVEGEDGLTVHVDKLAEELCAAAESGMTNAVIAATLEATGPEITVDMLKQNTELMGTFTTEFKTSAFGRRFNIWKMSTVINGLVLQPGEEWSINEAAGDRTTENGWADAAGIKSGAYVDEPGGGICQVSTTLYGAVLRSEVTVVDRKHHSWPSAYVPVGLDATISTGSPDFKMSNPYDYPITVIAKTDGEDARTITVSIYGPPLDYKLDFTSEIVKKTEPGPVEITTDPAMSPGTSVQTKPTKTGLIVDVYKHYYDKSTGEEIRDPEKIYTDTYSAFAGTIVCGPTIDPAAVVTDPAAGAAPAA